MSPEEALPLGPWLEGLGFGTPRLQAAALAALRQSGLLNQRPRTAIAAAKAPALAAELRRHFVVHCPDPDCARHARDSAAGRKVIPVTARARSACHVCGGSNTRRAFDAARRACHAVRLTRWLVVGGSPSLREELRGYVAGAPELTLDMDPGGLDSKAVHARAQRADVIAILGSSQINHKDTDIYTREYRPKVVQVRSRGLEGLFLEVEKRAKGGRS